MSKSTLKNIENAPTRVQLIIAVVGWLVAIPGWWYGFHVVSDREAKAEAFRVFAEVSQLLESANFVADNLYSSFNKGEIVERRALLWDEYELIQKQVRTGSSRYSYLLEKHFGAKMRKEFIDILDNTLCLDVLIRTKSEEATRLECHPSLVMYFENWNGPIDFTAPDDLTRVGLKWRMMKHLDPSIGENLRKEALRD